MSARKLRWLSLVGLLGLLGLPLRQPLLFVLGGFYAFGMFWRVDERSEANLGRAAAFAYVLTLIAFMICFLVVLSVAKVQGYRNVAGGLALSLVAVYAVHLLSFICSYIYFDAKGA